MADGLARERWGHTSAVLAMIASVNRDAKKRPSPYSSSEFNPFGAEDRRSANRALPKVKLSSVKNLLMNGARPRKG